MWNFNTHLARLEEQGRPIRVGLIGSGRFGTMIMAQVSRMKGMRISVVADLSEGNTRKAVERAGISAEAIVRADSTSSANEAIQAGKMAITEDSLIAIESDVDVIVEATGLTEPGARHAYHAISKRQAHRHGQRRDGCPGRPALEKPRRTRPGSHTPSPTAISRH